MKKIIIFIVVLSLLLTLTGFGNIAVFGNSSKETFIEQYNEQHIKQLLNKAYFKAMLLLKQKNPKMAFEKKIKPDGGSFETEYFDHYDFESGYRELRGYLIDYCVYHQTYPYTAHFTVDQIRSYSGSISVNGQITASLKNEIIGGISTYWDIRPHSIPDIKQMLMHLRMFTFRQTLIIR